MPESTGGGGRKRGSGVRVVQSWVRRLSSDSGTMYTCGNQIPSCLAQLRACLSPTTSQPSRPSVVFRTGPSEPPLFARRPPQRGLVCADMLLVAPRVRPRDPAAHSRSDGGSMRRHFCVSPTLRDGQTMLRDAKTQGLVPAPGALPRTAPACTLISHRRSCGAHWHLQARPHPARRSRPGCVPCL